MSKQIKSLKEIVGKGYKKFWFFSGRHVALKGGRGSKKSKTAALRWMYLLKEYPMANLLVVRQIFKDHRDSTFSDLKWAARSLGLENEWSFKVSPLEAVNQYTGQKILFRGLDDPMSITSITVDRGYLCWAWFEEAYQIKSEEDFNKVDMSIRGKTDGVFKQVVLTFNPWNEKHWLKKRFFDTPDSDRKLSLTTNYLINEFLDETDIVLFEEMKEKYPRRYKVEGLGDWGIAEGVIFDNWKELNFDYKEIAKLPGYESVNGLDFGLSVAPMYSDVYRKVSEPTNVGCAA